MNSVKKLNLIMIAFVGIPLVIGLYLLNTEETVLLAPRFHFYFVLVSAFMSFALSIIAVFEYQRTKISIVLMVAIGFLGVSIIYAFHGFITPQYSLFTFSSFNNQIKLFVLYGDLSRFWLAVFVFSSGIKIQQFADKTGLLKLMLMIAFGLLGLVFLMIYVPDYIPNIKRLDGTDTQFSVLLKVVTLILLGTTIQRYYSSFKIKPNLSVAFLIIGLVFIVGSVIIFMISTPWGLLWWMAHILYMLTYVTIGYGVYYNYYKNQKVEYFDVMAEVRRYVDELDGSNKQLETLANTDILTNIANRNFFMKKLKMMIEKSDNLNENFGLMFLDIDDFKVINDVHGHAVGDEVLRITSNRIKSLVKSQDIPARLAGDEFVIIVSNAKKEHLSLVADRLNNALSRPITINSVQMSIDVSIGIAIYPENGLTADELLNNSDQAMYNVKKKGKNSYKFYNESNRNN